MIGAIKLVGVALQCLKASEFGDLTYERVGTRVEHGDSVDKQVS